MIYECLQCQAPQSPGDVACPHCGAQFAGPVPEDATLHEEPEAATAGDAEEAAAATPPSPMPLPPMPSPMPYSDPASSAAATTYTPYSEPSGPSKASYPPLLVVGAVLGVLVLVGVVYFVMNLGQTAVSPPPPSPVPFTSRPFAPIQPVSTQTMTSAAPGSAPPSGAAGAESAPIGRWMTKTFDYYEFDQDGTGSRGSVNDAKAQATFSWVVVKNQMVLSRPSQSSTEKIPFSYGPGGGSLYLRQPDGRYLEYTKQTQ